MTTRVTFSATNQSRSSNNEFVVVANVRISWRRDRFPRGLGVRTHALRSRFPISNPAHRSCNNSTTPSPDDTRQQVTPSGGTTGLKSLTRVLEATIDSSCRWPPAPYWSTSSQGITDTSASRTNATPFSRLHGGPAQRPQLLVRYSI